MNEEYERRLKAAEDILDTPEGRMQFPTPYERRVQARRTLNRQDCMHEFSVHSGARFTAHEKINNAQLELQSQMDVFRAFNAIYKRTKGKISQDELRDIGRKLRLLSSRIDELFYRGEKQAGRIL